MSKHTKNGEPLDEHALADQAVVVLSKQVFQLRADLAASNAVVEAADRALLWADRLIIDLTTVIQKHDLKQKYESAKAEFDKLQGGNGDG